MQTAKPLSDDLAQLFAQAPGFMTVLRGPQHVFVIANQAYAQHVGSRELIGKTLREALPEIEGQGFLEMLDQVYVSGEPAHGTGARVSLQREPGRPREIAYVDFVYQPLRDERGEVTGIFVQGSDVTARMQAEGAAREARDEIESQARLFNTTLSAIRDFAYSFDRAGRFQYVNKPLLDLWGLSLPEAIGCNFHDLKYPQELAAKLQAQIEQVFVTRQAVIDETPYTSPSGQSGYYEYIFTPVLGADGEVEAVAGSTRDVSERKRVENLLREADRRKDEFLATLAHELRNPLAPIRHASSILGKPNATEAQLQWCHGIIDRQVQQMARLLDDLLDVSRITRGRLELRCGRFAVPDSMAAAVDAIRPAMQARRHELHVQLPPQPVYLVADPVRFEQIVGNLLTNAAKYTEPGGHVWLDIEVQDLELMISVRDSGIGIEPEMLPHVFEMFAQATSALERADGGLGIGLALVKGLVELHGGSIAARSEGLGKGSEFVVRLPLDPQFAASAAGPQQRASGPAASRRVLVVDDNQDAAQSLALALELDGHAVLQAFDGKQAMGLAADFAPEVVLLDIGLPMLNGYEVARNIRREPWGKSTILIAITGWAQEADRERARAAGFDHHLAKPVDLQALARLIS